jgi:hypothetical protein
LSGERTDIRQSLGEIPAIEKSCYFIKTAPERDFFSQTNKESQEILMPQALTIMLGFDYIFFWFSIFFFYDFFLEKENLKFSSSFGGGL